MVFAGIVQQDALLDAVVRARGELDDCVQRNRKRRGLVAVETGEIGVN